MDVKSSQPDSRYEELDDWCEQRLAQSPGIKPQPDRAWWAGLQSVSGDASFRRYFRARDGKDESFIVVDAPPQTENCESFVAIARSWRAQGLRTPRVHSVDVGRGYMLLEDFGDTLLYSKLADFQAGMPLPLPALGESRLELASSPRSYDEQLYDAALEALLALQQTQSPTDYPLPVYDRARLMTELQLFPEWCLEKLLDIVLTQGEQNLLADLFTKLVDSALAQPQVTVHRDYHSRNLMLLPDGLGLIDFQDAVTGPVTYDLVSLLRDCYIDWPQHKVYEWLDVFAKASPILHDTPREQLHQWFDWMGMQRHIKVLGIFVRLWLRDGKTGYLKDMPRVYAYVRWVCGRYCELQETARWLDSEVLPRLQQQSWWQEYQLKN